MTQRNESLGPGESSDNFQDLSPMTQTERQHRFTVIVCFALVYVFWGSTYLGIGIAVEHIPPAMMCGVRFLISGSLMLTYCSLTGRRVRYPAKELGQQAAVGLLLLVGGNLTLSWAEQYVPTGLAALLVASTPLWFLILDNWLIGHHRVSRRGLYGLALGVVGMVALLWPRLSAVRTLGALQFFAAVSVLFGAFSWALGSVLGKRWKSGADPFSATGWQMTAAGVANLAVALIIGEQHRTVWTVRGVGAVVYLIICGSWIGYTAYVWLLQHVPTSKVSTYAYVNPLVAVFLGWLVLSERVDHFTALGSAIIVASVILVTSAKVEKRASASELALPAVEAVGD
jgi:drug/metabolite transporter (DMT)-like permease